jgi:hypothetical protein
MGLRGVWVVAARCCASPPARCCADALERSFACLSANLHAPSIGMLNAAHAAGFPDCDPVRMKIFRALHELHGQTKVELGPKAPLVGHPGPA